MATKAKKVITWIKQRLKSRTNKLHALSVASLAVEYVLLQPATFGLVTPIQLLVVNVIGSYLREQTTKPVKDL